MLNTACIAETTTLVSRTTRIILLDAGRFMTLAARGRNLCVDLVHRERVEAFSPGFPLDVLEPFRRRRHGESADADLLILG